jgi:hypothetical protein
LKSRRSKKYRKTAARLAASLANLERARTASKDLVYRPTVKRLLACRANLLKALVVNRERSHLAGRPQDKQDEHPQVGEKEAPWHW